MNSIHFSKGSEIKTTWDRDSAKRVDPSHGGEEMGGHTFGGEWTEDNLACFGKYLAEYRQIFVKNERARYFKTW